MAVRPGPGHAALRCCACNTAYRGFIATEAALCGIALGVEVVGGGCIGFVGDAGLVRGTDSIVAGGPDFGGCC